MFLESQDRSALALAENLCAVFDGAAGASLGSIEETVFPLLHSIKDLKLSKGLYKVLSDSCDFKLNLDADFPAMRESIFRKSAALLSSPEPADYRAYRDSILASCSEDERAFIRNGIYADMPENEILTEPPRISPQELIQEYNISLVRSLAFFCTGMILKITGHDPAKMRRLFRSLKFFRLIAGIFYAGDKKVKGFSEEFPSCVVIRVGGPASIFENSRKYGLQLSSFLPSVFAMDQWEMDCRLELNGKERKMKLTNEDIHGIPPRMMAVYVPEEIKIFSAKFKETYPEWEIRPGEPVFDSSTREIIFPDFSFSRKKGKKTDVFHLELFHRWHGTQLPARLAFLSSGKNSRYILGIDNSLASKAEMKEKLDSSGLASQIFTFRDYPLPSKLIKILEEI